MTYNNSRNVGGGGCRPGGANAYRRASKVEAPRSLASQMFGLSSGTARFHPDGGGPRRRFNPGEFVKLAGQNVSSFDEVPLWEIVFCYRIKENPREWIYTLEDRKALKTVQDRIGQLMNALGLGEGNPKVFNQGYFESSGEATQYFWDIPCYGTMRLSLSNTRMMKEAKVVSSGEIIEMVKEQPLLLQ